MKHNNCFEPVIGQNTAKTTLSIFQNAFSRVGQLPSICLTAARGGGKSFMARQFHKGLERPDGTRPQIWELNTASIKNADMFFEQVYPVWADKECLIFFDEVHNLPEDLEQIFLSILNIDKNPVRTVEHDGISYTFDLRKMHFIAATTDQQKLTKAFRDRLRTVSLAPYTPDELYQIFLNNLDGQITFFPETESLIKQYFRGHPRDVVVKAQELLYFCQGQAETINTINNEWWLYFCSSMGFFPFGLQEAEIQIIKILGENGPSTLTALAAITNYERGVVQREYENILLQKGLLEIDGKRALTARGKEFYETIK